MGSARKHGLKLLIAGGGTGGHVIPAIAVAREWLGRDVTRDVVFVGTTRGLESRLVPEAGLKLELIRSAGLKGMGASQFIRNILLLRLAFWDSLAILRRHHFAAAFGVGGYAAGPVMLSAILSGLPTVIFEPNAEAGFTNRVLADMADRIAAGFPSVAEKLGRRAVMTGCPVRADFFQAPQARPLPPYRIFITGGSQGSRAVNRAVIEALKILASEARRLRIVHQTGEREYNVMREAYAGINIAAAEIAPFFSNMAQRFAEADLIICRSGAITVSEVAAAGRAAIFIPFGAATDSHQMRNAEELVRNGAAHLIPEPELTGARLAREILALIDHPERLVELGTRARLLARPHAVERIVDLIEEVARS
ncbi:MAG TPA: undecaprenyldiphospho-muramoylpentapeptide beta-N-acetylglucosaminyltransferase [Candidatus Acidoferrales bacterium]|nr:undecaprenyldiphospho-muramoylpentapeptide beta-N-acetylglucosaminyltransferase [Candidatus Acidoferrales bacterium]